MLKITSLGLFLLVINFVVVILSAAENDQELFFGQKDEVVAANKAKELMKNGIVFTTFALASCLFLALSSSMVYDGVFRRHKPPAR
ncbi:hypothetical protein M3Y96_00424600 [Aphelenchoides besseyi]|nr:hypothetical protein M3Y96_00424600 [Aphelenchoides besseyi]